MMAHSTYKLTLPEERWSIELDRDDVDRFMTILCQLLSGSSSDKIVWLTTGNHWRHWIGSNRHTVARASVAARNVVDQVTIPFTEKAVLALYDMLTAHERCEVTVEFDEIPQRHVLVISADGDSFCADIPDVSAEMVEPDPSGDTWCDLDGPKALMLSEFIRCWPSAVQTESASQFVPAFAHLTVDSSGVKCTMDWSRHGGNLATIGVSGTSHGSGTVQFDGHLVSRIFGRACDDEQLRVSFSSSDPDAVYFRSNQWCFMVKAQRECVVRWVWPVTSFLEATGFQITESDVVSDVPLVKISAFECPLEVSFVVDAAGNDDFLRVTLKVADNVGLNLDLADELNTFNNATAGVVAVVNSGALFLMSDVACSDFEMGLIPAIIRLHRHRNDLVPSLAMFGENPSFDSPAD